MRFLLKHFPSISDVESELRKLGLIRIFLGLLLLNRYCEIIFFSLYFKEYSTAGYYVAGVSVLIAVTCFTLGLFTSISTALTVFSLYQFDIGFNTYMLANAVAIQLCIFLFFANSGKYYSVDNYLLEKKSALPVYLRKFISFPGSPTSRQLSEFYIYLFLCYGIISFGAVTYHLVDEMWLKGETVSVLMTRSRNNRYYSLFRHFSISFPYMYYIFGRISTWGQIIFQLFMIPLFFFRSGRMFVFWWGLGFFLCSLFLLRLSWLPHAELLMWLVLFSRSGTQNAIKVLYDGKCNFCKRSISFLQALNFNRSIEFISLWEADDIIDQYRLDPEKIKIWMCGVYKDEVYFGYDLYVLIAKHNALYYVLLPILYLGKWTRLGYHIYSLVAKNRYKLAGTCELSPAQHAASKDVHFQYNTYTYGAAKVFYPVIFMLFIPFQLLPIPGSGYYRNRLIRQRHYGKIYSHLESTTNILLKRAGMFAPYVLNKDDLKWHSKITWPVIYTLQNGEKKFVPVFDEEGGRLVFWGHGILSNMGSDLVNYGIVRKYVLDRVNWQNIWRSGENTDIKQLILLYKNTHKINDTMTYYFDVMEGSGDGTYPARHIGDKEDPHKYDNRVVYSSKIPL